MRVGCCGRSLSFSPVMASLLLAGDDNLKIFVPGSFLVVRADYDSGANSLNDFEECDVVVGGMIENPLWCRYVSF